MDYAFAPERLFERFAYQVDATYVNRLALPARAAESKRTTRSARRATPRE
jgi:hypothetical protein